MKKNKYIIFALSLLVGCAPIPMDKEVLNKNNISYTLNSYQYYQEIFNGDIKRNIKSNRNDNYISDYIVECLVGSLLTFGLNLPVCFEEKKDYTTLAEANSLDCLYLNKNSDECINYRINHKIKDSKVHYFDYKRFLPKDSNIKTDDDFIRLAEKYKYCLKDENIEKNLTDYIYDGILEEKEEERKKKEQEIAQEIAQKKKEKSYIEDCKNAESKAEKYRKSIPSKDLFDLTYGRVVDFASNGVFVERPSERVFVYTKDTEYATGESFRSNGVYYKQNGYYKYTTIIGGTHSVIALTPTEYKVEKTDHEYYLKNKNIKRCYEDAIIYEENGEEKRIERKE